MIATLAGPYGRALGASARWLLVLIFAATSLGKLVDIQGFGRVLDDYRILPAAATAPVGLALALAELAVALGLSWHRSLRLAAVGGLVLALGNALLLSVTLLRGIHLANCGCFGVYWARPLRPWTPLEDLVLAGLALLVLAMPGARR
jgi:hypothetical protein